ncbi:hypothetical protein JB92DRAFT_1980036 [Gautieria morchelliformis]|nr:hypothetical protein JB92DRAFT_1980036 [Gautieria morchelliformis]
MERIVRADRERRRMDAPNGSLMPAGQPAQQPAPPLHEVPHRLPSAPPSLGPAPPEGTSRAWYRPRTCVTPGGTVMGDGGQPATVQGLGSMPVPPPGVFVPAPGGPQFPGARVQFPGSTWDAATTQYEEILNLLRKNRQAHHASIDQQREIIRYMAGLNEWLERDVHDRHAELRGVGDRIDQLRNELAQRLGIRPAVPGEGPIIPPPAQWFGPPPVQVREGSSDEGTPFMPPLPGHEQFPPGFIPYGVPGVPQ